MLADEDEVALESIDEMLDEIDEAGVLLRDLLDTLEFSNEDLDVLKALVRRLNQNIDMLSNLRLWVLDQIRNNPPDGYVYVLNPVTRKYVLMPIFCAAAAA